MSQLIIDELKCIIKTLKEKIRSIEADTLDDRKLLPLLFDVNRIHDSEVIVKTRGGQLVTEIIHLTSHVSYSLVAVIDGNDICPILCSENGRYRDDHTEDSLDLLMYEVAYND